MNYKKVLLVILILTIPYLILISNFYFYLYNEDFYYKEFEKNNIVVEDKEDIINNLFNYLKSKEELNYFNQREKTHLLDVKNLITKILILFYFLIFLDIILLIILINKKKFRLILRKIMLYSGVLTVSICILFFLLSLNFNFLFDNFHKTFFEEGTWLFLQNDLLIQLFPFNFFKDFFIKIILNTFVIGTLIFMGYYILRNRKV